MPKGHWPRGKRRNYAGGTPQIMAALADYLRTNRQAGARQRKLARHLRVSVRTLRRWLAGEDWPPPGAMAAILEIVRATPPAWRRISRESCRAIARATTCEMCGREYRYRGVRQCPYCSRTMQKLDE